jgi:restriction system protein
MAIPDFESIMLPLLECVRDGKEWSVNNIEESLINKFHLTEDEANQLKPSSTSETLFQNRLRWARFYLKKANLLIDPRRGFTQITQEGVKVLQRKPQQIDINYLKEFPSFVEFYTKKKTTEEKSISQAKEKSPEDMIIEGITEIRRGAESDILDRVKSCQPAFFEKIVVQLLEKMGYGVGTPTGKSGDGGIDGMIKQDKLESSGLKYDIKDKLHFA